MSRLLLEMNSANSRRSMTASLPAICINLSRTVLPPPAPRPTLALPPPLKASALPPALAAAPAAPAAPSISASPWRIASLTARSSGDELLGGFFK